MDVVALSGKRIAELDADELRYMVESGTTVRDLKRRLSAKVGCSRFQQRLMISGEADELQDDMPLTPLPSVQLVFLPICAHDETMEEEEYCQANQASRVERLLQKPQHPSGRALLLAADEGHLEVVRLLLEAGADKEAATIDGATTALIVAAGSGHLEVVRLLLEAGADKDAATTDGATALLYATHNGHLEVVRLLLEAGADKEAAMIDGDTA